MNKTKDTSTHYVSNKEFLQDFIEYKKAVSDAEREGKPKPRLPDSIGIKIMAIAERLSFKPNFINYFFREEMVEDAIENCIMYADNFDPEKSKNPFSYFTQICYFAFIRRIQKEKKHFQTKVKYVQRASTLLQESSIQDHDTDEDYKNSYLEFLRGFYDVELDEEDEKKERKKRETKTTTVDLTEVCDG